MTASSTMEFHVSAGMSSTNGESSSETNQHAMDYQLNAGIYHGTKALPMPPFQDMPVPIPGGFCEKSGTTVIFDEDVHLNLGKLIFIFKSQWNKTFLSLLCINSTQEKNFSFFILQH